MDLLRPHFITLSSSSFKGINQARQPVILRLTFFWLHILLSSCLCLGLQSAEFTYNGYESAPDEFNFAIINVSYVDPSSGRLHNQREEIGKYGRAGSVSGLVVHISLATPVS